MLGIFVVKLIHPLFASTFASGTAVVGGGGGGEGEIAGPKLGAKTTVCNDEVWRRAGCRHAVFHTFVMR
jgi:hypothetical protein